MRGVGREIVLVDVNRARAEAGANDIHHAVAAIQLSAGSMEAAALPSARDSEVYDKRIEIKRDRPTSAVARADAQIVRAGGQRRSRSGDVDLHIVIAVPGASQTSSGRRTLHCARGSIASDAYLS